MASCRHHHLLLLLLLAARYSSAQSPSNNNNPYFPKANFNPSMAILIVVLISTFFFLAFFSLYIRQCTSNRPTSTRNIMTTASSSLSRRHRGLDPQILTTFPTLLYSDVKSHKLGSDVSLECTVCLSEFTLDDTLRLLPICSHVFHPDCIDAWLASHATCPVCRSNLADIDPTSREAEAAVLVLGTAAADQERPIQESNQDEEEHVTIEDAEGMEELEKFVNMKRAKSTGRVVSFPGRSQSTGHSLVLPGENLDRFTLRLPESVRREIMLKRTASCVVFRGEEESGRRGFRGRSERWGSFLMRTVSMKGGEFFRRNESMKGEGSSSKG